MTPTTRSTPARRLLRATTSWLEGPSGPTTLDVPAATAPPQQADDPAVVARPVPVDPPPPPPRRRDHRGPSRRSRRAPDCCRPTSDAPTGRRRGARSVLRRAGRTGPRVGLSNTSCRSAATDRCGSSRTRSSTTRAPRRRSTRRPSCTTSPWSSRTAVSRCCTEVPPQRRRRSSRAPARRRCSTWFWPMGGEVHGDELHVVWVEMVKDAVDPHPPDGLGWHPTGDLHRAHTTQPRWPAATFEPAPERRRVPRSTATRWRATTTYTYLFGNSFEQNLLARGRVLERAALGDPQMYLATRPVGPSVRSARIPHRRRMVAGSPLEARADPVAALGRVPDAAAVHRRPVGRRSRRSTATGTTGTASMWPTSRGARGPRSSRVALLPRGGDPKMNTYHAHLVPVAQQRPVI